MSDNQSLERLYRLERQTREYPSEESHRLFAQACSDADPAQFPMAGYMQAWHRKIVDPEQLDLLMAHFAASQPAPLLAIDVGQHRYSIWHLLLALRCVGLTASTDSKRRTEVSKAWHIYDVILGKLADANFTDDDLLAVANRWEPEGTKCLLGHAN